MGNEEFDFIDCFEQYKRKSGVESINICTVPTAQRNVCNNIMLGLYKPANENAFVYAGLDHIIYSKLT